jgi:hypothetical protein
LFLLLSGGWLALSYLQYGPPVVERLIGVELVGSAIRSGEGNRPGLDWRPTFYYLGRAAPWSLLAVWGLWRVWGRPAPEAGERRFERFLFCWFAAGLILFSLVSHQRGDLIWPIIPAGALLAGRELARLTRAWTPRASSLLVAGTVLVAVSAAAAFHSRTLASNPFVPTTTAVRQLAAEIERVGGTEFPLTHVDAPMSLQFYLNTLRPAVPVERAARLLAGADPAFVAVADVGPLEAARAPGDPPWHVLLTAAAGSDGSLARIVGNRRELEADEGCAFCFGALCVRSHGARLLLATEHELRFAAAASGGDVILTNESAAPWRVQVFVLAGERRSAEDCRLAAGETRVIPFRVR